MYIINTKFLSLLFLLPSLLYGKNFEEGFIITLKNDTIHGRIADRKSETFPKIYKRIRFKKEGAFLNKKYNANQIKGYKAGNRVYESVGIEKKSRLLETKYILSYSYKKTFLRVIQKGKLSYFHWEHVDFEFNTIDYFPLFHLKEKSEMVRVTQGVLGLKRKTLSEYFSDCPELVKKIERKEVRTPEDIMDMFNKLCQ